tara:strand:- start:576 stop:809 length:234 start_codon:yes stop_codon:yes gene_type:complete
MDQTTFDEIVSTLAKCGRPDLIQEFKEFTDVDESYDPSTDMKKERRRKKEILSEEEGSADDEDLEFTIDSDGFHKLV